MKKVLITGGAGFIGSHTVDLLLEKGFHVTVLDNLLTGKIENLPQWHPNLTFIEDDILNFPLAYKLIQNVDSVLHLAAVPSVQKSIEDPMYTFKINAEGFLTILRAVYEASKEKPIRFVYASSCSVYGDCKDLPAKEERALAEFVKSPYALQKVHNENYAHLYEWLHNLNSLGLRYFNIYGPRQDPNSLYSGVISIFLKNYTAGKPMTIYGDGKQTRDFIYVSDIAYANYLALTSDYSGKLNIGTGYETSLLEILKTIEKIGDSAAKILFANERKGDIRMSYGDTKKAEINLSFKARYSLRDGLVQMMKKEKATEILSKEEA